MWITRCEARSRRLAACLCAAAVASGATLAACASPAGTPALQAPTPTDAPSLAADATGTEPAATPHPAGEGPVDAGPTPSRVPPVEAASNLTITGTVMDTLLSARVILLEEPVEGFDAVALTGETRLLSADGREIALRDVRQGRTVTASGRPGHSGALIPARVVLLDAPPAPPASATVSTGSTPLPTPTSMPPAEPVAAPTLTAPGDGSPVVRSFAAAPVAAGAGEAISVTWDALGEEATLCPLIGDAAVACRCLFGLPPAGSTVIEPADVIGAYTGFRLTVEAEGIKTVRYVPLVMHCPDRFSEWFLDDPPGLCPEEPPLSSYAAAQRFQHGSMIWLEARDEYVVLLDHDENVPPNTDGWSSLASLRVLRGPLNLESGASPHNRVDQSPPSGHFQPVRGFGLLWRGEVAGTDDLRAELGWAEEPEYGFDTVYQCEVPCGSRWDCYLRGPEGSVFHLYWLLHIGRFWERVG